MAEIRFDANLQLLYIIIIFGPNLRRWSELLWNPQMHSAAHSCGRPLTKLHIVHCNTWTSLGALVHSVLRSMNRITACQSDSTESTIHSQHQLVAALWRKDSAATAVCEGSIQAGRQLRKWRVDNYLANDLNSKDFEVTAETSGQNCGSNVKDCVCVCRHKLKGYLLYDGHSFKPTHTHMTQESAALREADWTVLLVWKWVQWSESGY